MIQEEDVVVFSQSQDDGDRTPLIGVRTGNSNCRRSIYLSFYAVWFLCYLVIGGVVFSTLEQPVETQLRAQFSERVKHFLEKFPSVPGCHFYSSPLHWNEINCPLPSIFPLETMSLLITYQFSNYSAVIIHLVNLNRGIWILLKLGIGIMDANYQVAVTWASFMLPIELLRLVKLMTKFQLRLTEVGEFPKLVD